MKTKKTVKPNMFLDFDFANMIQTKGAGGELYIEGYANTIDKDRVGDVILPAAFSKSLPMYLDNPVLLYQHDWDKVIGKVINAEINEKGLYIKALISSASDCEDVRIKIREGILKTLSIGYNEVDSSYNEATKTKVVKEVDLLEISVVTIPANPQSKFTPVEVEAASKTAIQKTSTVGSAVIDGGLNINTHHNKGETMGENNEKVGEPMTPAAGEKPIDGAKPAEPVKPSEPAPAPESEEEQGGKVISILGSILSELQALNGHMAEMKGCAGKPKEEPKMDAMPSEEGKSFEKMNEQEKESVLNELADVTAELERLQ